MEKHTPGPWYLTASSEFGPVHGGPEHRCIVPHKDPHSTGHHVDGWNGPEDVANRLLIAAAPDLLCALHALVDVAIALRGRDAYNEEIQLAEKALARAEGGAA